METYRHEKWGRERDGRTVRDTYNNKSLGKTSRNFFLKKFTVEKPEIRQGNDSTFERRLTGRTTPTENLNKNKQTIEIMGEGKG